MSDLDPDRFTFVRPPKRATTSLSLLEFLVIALDPPAQFGQVDQPIEGDFLR